jgi:rubrerythrin
MGVWGMKDIKNTDSAEEVMRFAIQKEQEAQQFYLEWAGKVESKAIADVLRGFAEEEKKHEAYLTKVQAGDQMRPLAGEVTNLQISDYLVEVAPGEEMDYQKALMVAMQREKSSFRLYSEVADKVGDTRLKELFLQLAQEEAKHKLRLETIYDDEILAEN